MTVSALMGEPPATERDKLIIQGILVNYGLEKKVNPARGFSPTGPPPDPRLTDSVQNQLVASCCVAVFVVLTITTLRMVTKSGIGRPARGSQIGWDDWIIVIAALSFIAYAAVVIAITVGGGAGKRSYNVTYEETEFRQRVGSATYIIFFIIVTTTKLSIICFNARLTSLTSTYWTWTHRFLFVIVSIYGMFFTVYAICQTTPVPAQYSYIFLARHPDFHYNIEKLAIRGHNTVIALTAVHVALDWILLMIPTYLIASCRLPRKTKLLCIVPLSVGCLSCIGAAYSAYLQFHRPKDISHDESRIYSWRFLDQVPAILATSLPSVAVLFSRAKLPSILSKYLSHVTSHGTSGSHIYDGEGDRSNPFTSQKPATNRDRYDRFSGVKPNDGDPEGSGTSWELGTHRIDKTQGESEEGLQVPPEAKVPRDEGYGTAK